VERNKNHKYNIDFDYAKAHQSYTAVKLLVVP